VLDPGVLGVSEVGGDVSGVLVEGPVDPLLVGKLLDTDVLAVEVLGVVWVLETLVDDDAELSTIVSVVLVNPEVLGVSVVNGEVSGLCDEVLGVSLDVLVGVDVLLGGGVLDPGELGVSEDGGDVLDVLVEGPLVLLPAGTDVDGVSVV